MRKQTIRIPMLLVLLSCCWLAGLVTRAESRDESRSAGQPGIDVARLESRIHDLINLERKNAGLPPLAWSQPLQRIARNYSQDMAARNFFSHVDPEGRTFVQRYRRAGFRCTARKSFFSLSLGGGGAACRRCSQAMDDKRQPSAEDPDPLLPAGGDRRRHGEERQGADYPNFLLS